MCKCNMGAFTEGSGHMHRSALKPPLTSVAARPRMAAVFAVDLSAAPRRESREGLAGFGAASPSSVAGAGQLPKGQEFSFSPAAAATHSNGRFLHPIEELLGRQTRSWRCVPGRACIFSFLLACL